jgi:hypothetical protein
MRRFFAPFLLLPLVVTGCNVVFDPGTQGSGVMKSEARKVGAFTKLRVATAAEVEVVRGDEPAIEVTADDNILPLISTRASGGELVISSRGSFSTSLGVRVKVTASALARIETSSASQLSVEDATADDLKLVLSGASKIDWTGGSKKVSVTASGASRVTLGSPINDLSVNLSGASQLHGFDATTATAKVETSGASRAEVNVLGKLDAEASGASTVVYAGSPQAKVKATGAGAVRAK